MFGGMERHRLQSSSEQQTSQKRESEERRRPTNVTPETSDTAADSGGQLTMGIIGCLPDNVQQAIKSFSIRRGKQHVTFAFPFMEDLIRGFDRFQYNLSEESFNSFGTKGERNGCSAFETVTPALFFDKCPEVIHGFETLVTLIPGSSRSSHLIGLLTLNQKETTEGFRRHIESLFRILVNEKAVNELKNLPLIALDMKGRMIQEVLNAGADAVLEIHGDNLSRTYPGKSSQELVDIIKEIIIRPTMIPYEELLNLNIQEVEDKLRNKVDEISTLGLEDIQRFDANHFHSLVDLLKSTSCTSYEYRQIHSYFMSPSVDSAVQEFWRIWSNEQVAANVFPVCQNKTRTGSFHYFAAQSDICLSQVTNTQSLLTKTLTANSVNTNYPSVSVLGSVMTRVPVKEGLISVIKCLKNQDLGMTSLKGESINLAYFPRDGKFIDHFKRSKGCKCGQSMLGTPGSEKVVARINEAPLGFSRVASSSTGLQSAFHTPRSTNFKYHQSLIPQNLMLVKPTSSYPPSSTFYTNKSLPEGIGPERGRQELLNQRTVGLHPSGMAPLPFILGYYGPIKNGSPGQPTHVLPSPIISLNNTPLLYCNLKSLEDNRRENW